MKRRQGEESAGPRKAWKTKHWTAEQWQRWRDWNAWGDSWSGWSRWSRWSAAEWQEWDNASWARRGDTWEGWTDEERRVWRASREPVPESASDDDLLMAEPPAPLEGTAASSSAEPPAALQHDLEGTAASSADDTKIDQVAEELQAMRFQDPDPAA